MDVQHPNYLESVRLNITMPVDAGSHVIAKFFRTDRAHDQIKYYWKTLKNTSPQWVEK